MAIRADARVVARRTTRTECTPRTSPDHHRRPARSGGRLRARKPLAVGLIAVAALLGTACVASTAPLGRRPAPTGPPERNIVFPIGREVSFSDTFGAPRGGGTRTHEGQDLMAPKMTPLVATVDGRISWMRWDNGGNAGNMAVLTDDDGWDYWYIHINNDTPFTDDGANRYDQAFADGVRQGQRVKAGEVIAWVGDSGNAENTGSHLHFEMHSPAGAVINPFNSLAHARLFVRTAAEAAADAPFGHTDSVVREAGGTLAVTGWGIDRYDNDPVHASVYVNGNPVASDKADIARADVAAAHPGRGTNHGYRITGLAVAAGAEVCVVLHSIDGGGNTRLPCSTAPA